MSGRRKGVISGGRKGVMIAVAIAVLSVIAIVVLTRTMKRLPLTIRGAVIREDADPRKQLPVAGAEVIAFGPDGLPAGVTKSDAAGFFHLSLRRGISAGQPIKLTFHQGDYQPLTLSEPAGDWLYVARLVPIPVEKKVEPNTPTVAVANVRVRYSVKTTTTADVGSAVKTFEVVNQANVPCQGKIPCSPDGKWKAAEASQSLDAGEGNEFRNVRVSCIAGPCPFTRIESDEYSRGGRKINVAVLNWSDTTTFLIEAEVFHPMISDLTRNSYPVVFGRALNFTLPAEAEGLSMEADLNGTPIVFPFGPALCLSWADCTVRIEQGKTKVFRCQLKPGYRF